MGQMLTKERNPSQGPQTTLYTHTCDESLFGKRVKAQSEATVGTSQVMMTGRKEKKKRGMTEKTEERRDTTGEETASIIKAHAVSLLLLSNSGEALTHVLIPFLLPFCPCCLSLLKGGRVKVQTRTLSEWKERGGHY